MKRRTILGILIPTLLIVAVALAVGLRLARRMPTHSDVQSQTSIRDSMEMGDRIESYETRISLCFLVGKAGIALAFVVVLYHISTLTGVVAWRARVFAAKRPHTREIYYVAGCFAATMVLAGLMLLAANSRHSAPTGDEISYLESAIKAREQFGVAGLPVALFSGRWSERNRHPLYIWTLMPLAARSTEFFAHARLLSTLFAAAACGVSAFVILRFFGAAHAVLVFLLFALSRSFLKLSSSIMCEGLLISLVMLSVYFTVRGFRKERLLPAAGAFAGLAYLTKVSGIFLPLAFFLTAVILWRRGAFRKRAFYLYFVAFILAGSPLLVRNTIRYKNPIANYNFSLLWLDSRQETDSVAFSEGRSGFSQYLRRHSALDLVITPLEGSELLLDTASNAVSPLRRSFYGGHGLDPPMLLRLWAGRLILLLAVVFLIFDTDVSRRAFMAVLAIVVFAVMAFYAKIVVAPRFVLPFAPLVLGYFAAALFGVTGRWRYRAAVLILAVTLSFWSVADRLEAARPFQVDAPAEGSMRLAAWLYENLEPGDLYLAGPDESLRFAWYHRTRGRTRNIPETRDVPSLFKQARVLGARYVVISSALYYQRVLQFSGWITFEGKDLRLDAPIDGWTPVFTDPVPPADYIVFEIEPSAFESREEDAP